MLVGAVIVGLAGGAAVQAGIGGGDPQRGPLQYGSVLRSTAATGGVRLTFGTAGEVVFLYTADMFRATDDLTLRNARPNALPPGVELLESRIVFHHSPTRVQIDGNPGGICTDRYPPRGYGMTEPVANARIQKGEVFSLLFFIRADSAQPGERRTKGARVTYTSDDALFAQQTDNSEVVMHVRSSLDELPAGTDYQRCVVQPDDGWFLPPPGSDGAAKAITSEPDGV